MKIGCKYRKENRSESFQEGLRCRMSEKKRKEKKGRQHARECEILGFDEAVNIVSYVARVDAGIGERNVSKPQHGTSFGDRFDVTARLLATHMPRVGALPDQSS